ncbi:hypothetical protein [Micromonospora palomenae]|uniref:hypothetical protein n=1 Tax=Micromonospora palomenae TaxID=1461247 RepID=UPI003F8C993F
MKFDRRTWLYIAGSVVCFLLASALGMAYISMTYQAPPGEEQPKVTDWMQAWGSILGVFAGLAAAVAATALLLHERKQARQARDELAAERAEAALAVVRAVIIGRTTYSRIDPPSVTMISVKVHNYGPAPVRRVTVVVAPAGQGTEILMPPLELLPPGGAEFDLKVTIRGQIQRDPARETVKVYFHDVTGVGWQKGKDGEPEKWSGKIPAIRRHDDEAAAQGSASSSAN